MINNNTSKADANESHNTESAPATFTNNQPSSSPQSSSSRERMFRDIHDFRQFHAELDETVIGYHGFTRGREYVVSGGAIVVCSSPDEFKAWMIRNGQSEVCHGLTFITCPYYNVFHYSHEHPIPHFFDAPSLERFQECRKQDQRFLHAIKSSDNAAGTYLAPIFDIYEHPTQAFRDEVNSFLIGYGFLSSENELIQDSEDRALLVGAKRDAEARALELKATVIPFTAEQFSRHEDEGYVFRGDAVVEGRLHDLARYQDYCNEME